MKNLDNFLKKIIPRDKESVIVWHRLSPGEIIEEHSHKDYEEFVLIDNSDFEIIFDGIKRKYNLKDEPVIISFPAGLRHGFINGKSPIEYFVIRIKL